MKTNLVIAVLVAVGVIGQMSVYRQLPPTAICGADLPVFYIGAQLARSPDLYSPEVMQRIERQEAGCTTATAAFIRLPYFAAVLWPLTLLPLGAAFALWRAVSIAAEIGFVALFPGQWKWALLAWAWCTPLSWGLVNGQDVAFLLLWIAGGMVLVERRHPLAAGLCFALCAAKFHLFVLFPVLLITRRMWRVAAGMLAAGVVMLAISFGIAGWNWPARYARAISNPTIDINPMEIHNIRALVRGSLPFEVILGLTVVVAVWCVCRRASWEMGIASVLLGGLLISHHLVYSDRALTLPACLLISRKSSHYVIQAAAVVMLTPLVTHVLDPTHVPEAALLLLLYAVAYEAVMQPRPKPAAALAPLS